VVCGYFKAETEKALTLAGVEAEVVTFPSQCSHPPTDWHKIFAEESSPDQTYIVLGGCCTTNLDTNLWPDKTIHLHHIEQCFYLFMQPEVVDHFIAKGYHLITPGWLSGWKNQIEHIMGFDQTSARAFFQETAKTLLLVDTASDPHSESKLAEMAEYLKIPAERVAVGLDFYSQLLLGLVDAAKREEEQYALVEALKQQSEYAMVADLLGKLTDQKSEYDITHALLDTFQMLLAPELCCYQIGRAHV